MRRTLATRLSAEADQLKADNNTDAEKTDLRRKRQRSLQLTVQLRRGKARVARVRALHAELVKAIESRLRHACPAPESSKPFPKIKFDNFD